MANLSIPELKKAIERSNATWQAEETPFVKMSQDEQVRLLGYTPGPNDGILRGTGKRREDEVAGLPGNASYRGSGISKLI